VIGREIPKREARHVRIWGRARSSPLTGLVIALACALAFGSGAASEERGAAIGADAIKILLMSHPRWTAYWDRADVARPRFGARTGDRSQSATLEFLRTGTALVGHAEVHGPLHLECEFEVTVRDDGFTFGSCGGSPRSVTYDPIDRDYPFKGRIGSESLWLAPAR
jgi:hypothetical protein